MAKNHKAKSGVLASKKSELTLSMRLSGVCLTSVLAIASSSGAYLMNQPSDYSPKTAPDVQENVRPSVDGKKLT